MNQEIDFQALLSNQHVIRLTIIVVGMVLIMIVNGLIKKAFNRAIRDTDRKYKARKAMNMFAYALIISIVLFVYSDKLGNVGVALGVAGAGIAFALQEVIVSIAGWLTMLISGSVSVGQRVKIGEVRGDVIDIGVFNTTIMEMGDWVDGDLYNGRIVTISNSYVYKEKIHNYSAEYPFLWDEIRVPIRNTSDYEFAQKLFERIINEICGDYADKSEQEWKNLANKYRVEVASVDPMVTVAFDENWITFTLRYIVDYKRRRGTKHMIFKRLLDEINANSDKIQFATASIEVTNMN